ncbi:SymE family type I addiction module toxin [Serratia fonticola]|uniref:SymE family type I addiction module toxin n=1 Tax=Serratia fonticola TaxID=47917 RepID=A0ABY9PVM6_SERFO|nr:SymE family type I addiction module toxin [Serratia fonticola]WMT16740.1 SymE family type I addiction module toxin [Serratia fonticola]
MRDNSELYLAGDWFTQCGLTGQPLAISMIANGCPVRRLFRYNKIICFRNNR